MHVISSSPQPFVQVELINSNTPPHPLGLFIDKETKLFLSTYLVSGRSGILKPLMPTHTTKKLFLKILVFQRSP